MNFFIENAVVFFFFFFFFFLRRVVITEESNILRGLGRWFIHCDGKEYCSRAQRNFFFGFHTFGRLSRVSQSMGGHLFGR